MYQRHVRQIVVTFYNKFTIKNTVRINADCRIIILHLFVMLFSEYYSDLFGSFEYIYEYYNVGKVWCSNPSKPKNQFPNYFPV